MSKHYFGDASGVARRMKRLYFGVETQVPVYEEVATSTQKALSLATVNDFFSVYYAVRSFPLEERTGGGLQIDTGWVAGSNYSTTLTAQRALTNVVVQVADFRATGSTMSITANGESIVSTAAGDTTGTDRSWTGDLPAGAQIAISASSGASKFISIELQITCDPITETVIERVQTGTEVKGLARRLLRAYYSEEGVAQAWWEEETERVAYTGEYTVRDVTINGASYKLYTLTGDGELTLSAAAQYWMNGGGASGQRGNYSQGWYKGGLGGGGGYIDTGELTAGAYSVTIGQGGARKTSGSGHNAGTATTITGGGETRTAAGATNGDGASGGGGSGASYSGGSSASYLIAGGSGQGASTVPFALDELGKHSAGGAGGVGRCTEGGTYYGGDGGSDGANGSAGTENAPGTTGKHATGGELGGGDGGNLIGGAGADASGYGSGGGGGSAYYPSSDAMYGAGGAGYQGVVYLLLAA